MSAPAHKRPGEASPIGGGAVGLTAQVLGDRDGHAPRAACRGFLGARGILFFAGKRVLTPGTFGRAQAGKRVRERRGGPWGKELA